MVGAVAALEVWDGDLNTMLLNIKAKIAAMMPTNMNVARSVFLVFIYWTSWVLVAKLRAGW